jgi:hypothetical protein
MVDVNSSYSEYEVMNKRKWKNGMGKCPGTCDLMDTGNHANIVAVRRLWGQIFSMHNVMDKYIRLAEMPGVARVDHRTKCVSLVAISQNFETRNCWAGLKFHPP